MSMPQPIFVVLIGLTVEQVTIARKYFRLSALGMGPAYLCAINAPRVKQAGGGHPLLARQGVTTVNGIAIRLMITDHGVGPNDVARFAGSPPVS